MPLKTETNTPEMEARIEAAARTTFGDELSFDLTFEHGQWWLTIDRSATFAVVDAIGGRAVDGFDFEQV